MNEFFSKYYSHFKTWLRTKPLYLFFLAVFFVYNGYVENFNFIPVKDAALILLLYLISSGVLLFIFYLFYRNILKAGLVSFLILGFYLFFGYIYDRIQSIAPHSFIGKYSVILVTVFLSAVLLFILLKRYKGSLKKGTYILNIFLLLLLLVDTLWLAEKIVLNDGSYDKAFKAEYTKCDSCSKPDIYLIVTDEYAGDKELRDLFHFDNSPFKNQLKERGFYCPETTSNYNYTPYSIASMLQMHFLTGIKREYTNNSDMTICYLNIRRNNVCRFLQDEGYAFYNYSLFDVLDQPSPCDETILPTKTEFITAQTLFSRLNKFIEQNFAGKLGEAEKKRKTNLSNLNNHKIFDLTEANIHSTIAKPKFVYTHFLFPHFPYFYDQNGNLNPENKIADSSLRDTSAYLGYLLYANKRILTLIDDILKNSRELPVIILVSDHGFRWFPAEKFSPEYSFNNMLAILLPDKKYAGFYNGISNVNLFRVLFNTEFNQHFPLLKDSTSRIVYQQD